MKSTSETRVVNLRLLCLDERRCIFCTRISSVSTKGNASCVCASPLSRRKETLAVNACLLCLDKRRHLLCTRASCVSTKGDPCWQCASLLSRRKEIHVVNPCLLYLDERVNFWGPPVSIKNVLLCCPLHCWHTCNGRSM
jgi:hypothetical protein